MATLIPSRDIIDSPDFLPKLEHSEEKLLATLCVVLPDPEWTIYIQPFLNGKHPDFILFNPQYGITIIEVKDLDYTAYRVSEEGMWLVHKPEAGRLETPFEQVLDYKNKLIDYEAPLLRMGVEENKNFYSAVTCVLYFAGYSMESTSRYWQPQLAIHQNKYVRIVGDDTLQVAQHAMLLSKLNLARKSDFSELLSQPEMITSLQAALGYPDLGDLTLKQITTLNAKQRKLAHSKPEYKHIKGAAGSGKTLVIANRAADAIKQGRSVLITCFNITMRNYLRDVAIRACRAHNIDPRDRLQVDHFHLLASKLGKKFDLYEEHHEGSEGDTDAPGEARIKQLNQSLTAKSAEDIAALGIAFDSILVDEGQDFEPNWIECLRQLQKGPGKPELVIMSDPAQNLYAKDQQKLLALPGFIGRPPVLKESYRLKGRIAETSRLWLEKMTDSDLETSPVYQRELLFGCVRWQNLLDVSQIRAAVLNQVRTWQRGGYQLADIAIIVANKGAARFIQLDLVNAGLAAQATFTTIDEDNAIRQRCKDEVKRISDQRKCGEAFKKKYNLMTQDVERPLKLAFRLKGGQVKISTIHSFKGWEWRNVIVILDNIDETLPGFPWIVYTSLTRAQESLLVLNNNRSLDKFQGIMREASILTE